MSDAPPPPPLAVKNGELLIPVTPLPPFASLSPPRPPVPGVVPAALPPAHPTLICSTSPGVAANVPTASAPGPPDPGVAPFVAELAPPGAPNTSAVTEVTPAGTVHSDEPQV